MKVSVFVPSFILVFYCVSVHGELNIFGGIKDIATKVKDGIESAVHINTNENSNQGSIVFKDSEEEVPVVSTSQTPEVTTPIQVETTTPTVINNNTTGKINATEKDGRENFAGGCSTGYMRTADGRCKPTFG